MGQPQTYRVYWTSAQERASPKRDLLELRRFAYRGRGRLGNYVVCLNQKPCLSICVDLHQDSSIDR